MGWGLGALMWASTVGAADTGGWPDGWGLEAIDAPETCNEGATRTVSAIVDNPSGVDLSFMWTQDTTLTEAGFEGISGDTDSDTIQLTCPPCSLVGATDEVTLTLYTVATDPVGNTAWAFGEYRVLCNDPLDDVDPGCDVAEGCSVTPLGAASSAGVWLLLLALRRRQG